MNKEEFNLIYERWIRVLGMDGVEEEISMEELFERAHQIRSLAGELPTQDFAIMRLILAILYAVYLRQDVKGSPLHMRNEEDALSQWDSIWSAGRFDSKQILGYLKRYEDRFYLFHPDRPFYQIHLDKGTEYKASKLLGDISESSNKVKLFSSRNGVSKERIGFAEAARWVLHLNAFDDNSSKPTQKKSGLPPVGAGWLGKLGLVYIQGNNLFETLLLNLVLADSNGEPIPAGEAIWEADVVCKTERRIISTPNTILGMLTLQSRRFTLIRDGSAITGYQLIGGDVFPAENTFIEQMTRWRQDKKSQAWFPRRHDPSKQMWRDYSSLVMRSSSIDSDAYRAPGVVEWISSLIHEGCIQESVVRLGVVGVKYGDKDFFLDDVFEDSMSLNGNLLTSLGLVWNIRIDDVIAKTDKCVYALGKFASNLEKASGNSDEKNYTKLAAETRTQAFYRLDDPFRKWLLEIEPKAVDSLDECMEEWIKTMRRIVLDSGNKLLDEASDSALVGRSINDNALVQFKFFKNAVYKITKGA